MIDAYSSVGLPINYHHWSFGKQFVATEQTYRRGQMGLAYEIVINSDPCIAYLDGGEHAADAGAGHCARLLRPQQLLQGQLSVRTWTSADAIIDYLVFARKYIAECEERYGYEEVSCCSIPATL
jgi:stage V sporulation protein R